ncbi:non-specific serine/threonine protein kinase [Fonsecaea pedrosoi]|nr:non-specific serine/threonine protein kinase [Fonsecaea pedrosoi]
MDLERIKQSLRLRSGRSKKPRKQPTAELSSTAARPSQPAQKTIANGEVKPPPRVITKARPNPRSELPVVPKPKQAPEITGAPKLRQRDSPVYRPQLPHASTDVDAKVPTAVPRPREECPPQDPGQEPGSNPAPLLRTTSEGDPGVIRNSESSSVLDFDLHPPPPPSRPRPPSVETLSESLFSSGHLNTLLRDPQYLARFTTFLTRYRPQYHPVLLRYLDTQKAIKAIEYANAVAEGLSPSSDDGDDGDDSNGEVSIAATLDRAFEQLSNAAFRLMVDSALPMYVTYNLVKLVTECLIDEITGSRTSSTRDLVGGLSEVFCLTDPKQEDNPIIFASDEFYRQTGYGRDNVIGRNCRFLQGSKTNRESIARLKDSIARGEDICETLLNYRRDGRAFINLLMIAPLHDDKGNVKYHIGAQVDVTGMVERGKGFEGLKRYLTTREMERREREACDNGIGNDNQGLQKSKALAKLRDLSEMFDLEESVVVRSNGRSTSTSREDDERSVASSRKVPRRVFDDADATSDGGSEESAEDADKAWELGQSGRSGLSGKLPGVYDSYILVRPAPSLRIVFVSSVLRRRVGNIIQHPFLSHVAAPTNTLKGLKESFSVGVPVSAKINLLLEAGNQPHGTATRSGGRLQDAGQGRVCWISATPLLGGDDKVGVWMIVVVENAKVPKITRREPLVGAAEDQALKQSRSGVLAQTDASIKIESQAPNEPALSDPSKSDIECADAPTVPKTLHSNPEDGQNALSSPPPAKDDNIKKEIFQERDSQQVSAEDETLVEPEEEKPTLNHASPDEPEHLKDDKNGFVRTNGAISSSPSPPRTYDHVNGLGEPKTPTATELNNALERAVSGTNVTKTWAIPLSPADNHFTGGLNGHHGFSDDEKTPINLRKTGLGDHTPSPSRPGTSGVDSSTGKSNGKHYMDYLLHPGSRPSSEYNRTLSGSFMSAKYNADDEPEEEVDDFNDSECARTPYSVD